MTTPTRFSQYFVVRARKPVSWGTLRLNDATATRKSLKKWICVLSVFIAIIPTYLLCQISANPPEVEFQGTISGAHHIQVQKAEIKFRRCLFPFSTKHEIRHFHVVVVQKRQRNVQKIVWFINCFIISSNNS